MNGPDFALCGPFTGKNGQSATRWLKKLEWELRKHSSAGSIDPADFLQAVDLLLADDAAVWAETTPLITQLLETPAPTSDTVSQFKSLFSQRYPIKISETAPVHFDSEISDLRQQEEEALIAYYQRTTGLLSRVGGRDRPREITLSTPALSPLEAAMLDTVMRAFTRGIWDSDIRRDALRGLVLSDRSLYGVYSISEESRRVKGEYAHLQEEEAKAQELQFYQEVVQSNMPSTQINSLRASFHAQYMPQWGYPSQPAYQQSMSWSAPVYQTAPPFVPQPTQWPMPTLTPAYQSAPPYYAPRPFQLPSPPSALCSPAIPPALSIPPVPPTLYRPPAAPLPAAVTSAPPAVTSLLPAVQPALSALSATSALSALSVTPTPLAPPAEQVCPLPDVPSVPSALSVPPAVLLPPAPPAPSLPPAVTPAPSAPPAVGVRSITYGVTGLRISNVKSNVKLDWKSNVDLNKKSNVDLNKCAYIVSPARPELSVGQDLFFRSRKRAGKTATITMLSKTLKMDKEEEEPG